MDKAPGTRTSAGFSLGVSLNRLDKEQRPETIGILKGSSVRALELWEATFPKGDDSARRAREAAEAAGVRIRSVHAAFGERTDISSLDDDARASGMLAVQAAVCLAAEVGAGIVVVHPSSEPIADGEREARMEIAKRGIELAAGLARDAGIRLAVELLPRTCLGRCAEELFRLLEDTDAGAAGICLDTNHLMDRFDSLPGLVRRLGPRLLALHCSDYDGVDEKHWVPLRGVIDWAAFLAALRHAAFPGPVHYEAQLEGGTPAERLTFLEENFSRLMSAAAAAT